jgi:hypothetical protein
VDQEDVPLEGQIREKLVRTKEPPLTQREIACRQGRPW